MRALSLTQPWCDAILYAGKRVENRLLWSGSSFRGDLLLHAAKGMRVADYDGVVRFVRDRKIAWRPKPKLDLVRGAIVGRARVIDVIMPGGLKHAGAGYNPSRAKDPSPFESNIHSFASDPFYMGGFALVLDDVVAFAVPIPCNGALGFWRVPESVYSP